MTVADESYLRPPVWSTVDLQTGERVDVHRGGGAGLRPGRATPWSGVPSRRWTGPQVPAVLVRRHDTPLDGTRPLPDLRLRLLRGGRRAGVGRRPAGAARPRRRVGARPSARRRRDGPALVARRQPAPQAAHVRRRRRGRGRARPRAAGRRRADRDPRAERRRAAAGRAVQPAAGPVAGRGGGGAVRRRGDHDVRRDDAADHHRVGGVGRPAGARGVRLDARLLAVRPPAARRVTPRPAGDRARSTTRG